MKPNTIMAGGITHLTDARFFAAYAVDYLGFCFDPQSPNYIAPTQALAIKGWVTGPEIVAEFANQDPTNVQEIIRFMEPSCVLVQDTEWPALQSVIEAAEIPVIIRFTSGQPHQTIAAPVALYLFSDTRNVPAGFAPGECMFEVTDPAALNDVPPGTAVYISGSPEQETGIKSYDTVADWLEKMTGREA